MITQALKIVILKNYLKIGVLKIKFKNQNFGKLNLRIRILEIEFERNWSFEN